MNSALSHAGNLILSLEYCLSVSDRRSLFVKTWPKFVLISWVWFHHEREIKKEYLKHVSLIIVSVIMFLRLNTRQRSR